MKSWKKCVYTASLFAMFAVVSAGRTKPVKGAKAAPDTKVQVKIDNFAFSPMDLTVTAGTTVEWVNRDDIPHVVVSDDTKTFKSKALDTDDKFSFTFTKPGTYTYFCSVHPKMTGRVVVQ
jgi:plastocyanin